MSYSLNHIGILKNNVWSNVRVIERESNKVSPPPLWLSFPPWEQVIITVCSIVPSRETKAWRIYDLLYPHVLFISIKLIPCALWRFSLKTFSNRQLTSEPFFLMCTECPIVLWLYHSYATSSVLMDLRLFHAPVIAFHREAWHIFKSMLLAKTVSSMFPGTQNKSHFENVAATAKWPPDQFTLPTIAFYDSLTSTGYYSICRIFANQLHGKWDLVVLFYSIGFYSIDLHVYPYRLTVLAVHFSKCEIELLLVCLLAVDTCFLFCFF